MLAISPKVLEMAEKQLVRFEENAVAYLNELKLTRHSNIVLDLFRTAGLSYRDKLMHEVQERLETAAQKAVKEVCDGLKATITGNDPVKRSRQVSTPIKPSGLTCH